MKNDREECMTKYNELIDLDNVLENQIQRVFDKWAKKQDEVIKKTYDGFNKESKAETKRRELVSKKQIHHMMLVEKYLEQLTKAIKILGKRK